MPELPEVEATRLSFARRITGAHISALRLGKALRWPLGCADSALLGHTVTGVRRRSKYLLLDLHPNGLLLLHLGMSGSLSFSAAPAAPGAHDHFDLITSRGVLRLNDPRRFGAVVWVAHEQAPMARKLLGGLGPEPLEPGFEVEAFYRALRQRRAAIKQVLLAGEVVVGVGNIYASESLFEAGIRPSRRAERISRAEAQRLHTAIRAVLQRALDSGGSTLRNFSNAHGQAGEFQLQAQVYDRAGLPCLRCASPIKLLRQGQRSSFYCPHCQPR